MLEMQQLALRESVPPSSYRFFLSMALELIDVARTDWPLSRTRRRPWQLCPFLLPHCLRGLLLHQL